MPARLLSVAGEIRRSQANTKYLVNIPDWTYIGRNETMCSMHQWYKKVVPTTSLQSASDTTTGPPFITIAPTGPTVPIPVLAPAPTSLPPPMFDCPPSVPPIVKAKVGPNIGSLYVAHWVPPQFKPIQLVNVQQ